MENLVMKYVKCREIILFLHDLVHSVYLAKENRKNDI